jgi:hypothetical protein
VFLYWIIPNLCGFSIVIVEQSTESLPFDQRAICRVIVGRLDQPSVKALMRALYVVVSHVLADEFSQVHLTQRDDAVDAVVSNYSTDVDSGPIVLILPPKLETCRIPAAS